MKSDEKLKLISKEINSARNKLINERDMLRKGTSDVHKWDSFKQSVLEEALLSIELIIDETTNDKEKLNDKLTFPNHFVSYNDVYSFLK